MPYQNPYNLVYYVFSGLPVNEVQILKQHVTETVFGTVTAGIIGSSHFFSVKDKFCELLTCQELHDISGIYQKKIVTDKKEINYHVRFNGFDYSFQLNTEKKTKKDFFQTESRISTARHTLILPFNTISAFTVIDILHNSSKELIISTIHTYPENLVIVKTESQLLLKSV